MFSFWDTMEAAHSFPVQLTALRASVSHRVHKHLEIRWCCPLTSALSRVPRTMPPITFAAAAFRDAGAAAEWQRLAKQLDDTYASHSSTCAEATARRVSECMAAMAALLPFACCAVVQRLLRLPLLNVDLSTTGCFVYCLVSPLLAKVYVGAVGFKKPRSPYTRLREHLKMAKLWASPASSHRYGYRAPGLYKAIAKVGLSNVVQVILAAPAREKLAATECAFIRQLAPVFNVIGVSGHVALPRAVQRLCGSSLCEDVRIVAAQILRHNNPKLPAQAWPVLIAQVRQTGDRELAAKLARQARQLCPKLSKLRSAPCLLFPCPIPKQLLQQLNLEVKAMLRALPFVCRTLHYDLHVQASSLSWQKTPFADALLAPSRLPIDKVAPCRCHELPSQVPRYKGHAITRSWAALPCCADLARFHNVSLQCRTFSTPERICVEFGERLRRFLKTAGFVDEHLDRAVQACVASAKRLLEPWLCTLPPYMLHSFLTRARQRLWSHGMVMARIDRNPGRLVALCRALWVELQEATFLSNERYVLTALSPSDDDINYANAVRDSFLAYVAGADEWAGRKPSGALSRPRSYFTVKQKSLIESVIEPLVKLRPLVTHSVHPMRIALGRLARAASLLVCAARLLVMARCPSHLPMWQLHSGSREWLERISGTTGWWGCDEYDVADCFLNTPRHEVLDAARFWLDVTTQHTRRQPCFAIAKDGKKGDHCGRPSSIHYWTITHEQLLLSFEWDLANNDTFEVQNSAGLNVVVQQRKGLPIGGHLSAAYVELVALRREYQCCWPATLANMPTARYRDNFFVVLPDEPSEAERQATASALSALLRASVSHRVYKHLEIRWCCPLTSALSRVPRTMPPITFAAAAFRDAGAAAEWQRLAKQLDDTYASHSSTCAEATARRVSECMAAMAALLPFACCAVVQRLLRLPLLNVDLSTTGCFVYCLVSPLLAKVYVGAVGFKKPRSPYTRLREHLKMAKLWASPASSHRYGYRAPGLYKAIAKVGLSNVVQVILAAPAREKLAATECAFIRQLAPVFNVIGVSGHVALPRAVQRLCGSSLCEDVRIVAAQILRHNNPKLPAQAWPVLIAQVRQTGDRELAAKLARQARQLCPKLSKLRSAPCLLFPCPIPKQLLQQLNLEVKAMLRALPFVCRTLHYDLHVQASSLSWQKTPFADALLAPSRLPIDKVAPCRCHELPSQVPRYKGHAITRSWAALPCCADLARFHNVSLQCRTFSTPERICVEFGERLRRFLKTAGFVDEHLDRAVQACVASAKRLLEPWLCTLPPYMLHSFLTRARQRLWSHGMVMARIDRNPGRLVALCRALWVELQEATFLSNERYVLTALSPSDDDINYANAVRDSFLAYVAGADEWAGRKPSGALSRPRSYFTVKQKSLIESVIEPLVKLRPLVTHSVHPMRIALGRLARAASLLVCAARLLVMARCPSHLPMWQLHSGSREWLERISGTTGWWGCDEYDVADCFLNTPRHEVLDAARFWLDVTTQHTRRQPCFAIAKDGKKGDHCGRPSSIHYWTITHEQLLLSFEWDLANNDTFEVQNSAGLNVVVQQRKGLPIGGHLSAAYVELVALRREYQCCWPATLANMPTARYRDNFFVVLPDEPSEAERQATASALSALLLMPVGFERGGRAARCLELRISWSDSAIIKAVLAYRTDDDRQGESRDVGTWPDWRDPRARAVLPGLLAGLASKLTSYSHCALGGLPASLRQALQFLRCRGYPTKYWLRPFALQLLRLSVPVAAMPRALRAALLVKC